MGIRLALGASHNALGGLLLSQGLRIAGAGVALGLGGASLGGRLLGPLPFEVLPWDPLILGAVIFALLLVAISASALAAFRVRGLAPSRSSLPSESACLRKRRQMARKGPVPQGSEGGVVQESGAKFRARPTWDEEGFQLSSSLLLG